MNLFESMRFTAELKLAELLPTLRSDTIRNLT